MGSMKTGLPRDAVIMVWEAEASSAGASPFMLRIRQPGTMRPVGFASKDLAETLVERLDLGCKLRTAPADEVRVSHPQCFASGEIVLFEDKRSISRFVREADYLPLREL